MTGKIVAGLVGLGLLAGAYLLGRWDAPDPSPSQSLLDGIQAYHDRYNQLTRELAQARRSIAQGLERERQLAKKRTPTPKVVPSSCAPWAENLATCDQQLGELRSQVRATGRLLGLAEAGRLQDSTRADSLHQALEEEVGKGKILGIQLPSRKTSFAAGGVTAVLLCLLVPQPC